MNQQTRRIATEEKQTVPENRSSPRRYRWQGALLGAALVAALGGAGAWAVFTVLQPADDPLSAQVYTYAEVSEGEVGAELLLGSVAQWRTEPIGENRAAGVVTAVNVTAGDEVNAGDALYAVNLRPVVIAQGATPAFRSIGEGDHGPDVKQVQELLSTLGFYRYVPDGVAGAGTVSAIKAWQKSLGIDPTGQVELGDVVFVSDLPVRIALDAEQISKGSSLAGGERVIRALSAEPVFTLPVTDAQAGMIPTGTRVELTAPDGASWTSVAAEQQKDDETGALTVRLAGVDGASICNDECGQIPVSGQAQLDARVVTVEPIAGLVVPSAALVTRADGSVAVIDGSGNEQPVTVVVSAKGNSVIEGLEAGTRVRIPAEAGADE